MLANQLTQWATDRSNAQGLPNYVVSTGGGPGMMEAVQSLARRRRQSRRVQSPHDALGARVFPGRRRREGSAHR